MTFMKLKWLSPLRLQVALVFVLGLFVIWGITAYLTQQAWNTARSNAEERSLLYARSFAEHARTTARLIDLAATELARAWANEGARDFKVRIESVERNISDITVQLGVTNGDGMLVYSDLGLPGGKPVNLRDREHIRVHLDSDQDKLFISRPVKGRVSGKWSIQFTRPIRRDGRNVGVIVLSVDPGYFSRYYENVAVGENSVVSITRDSGELLARAPGAQEYLETLIKGAPYLAANAPVEGTFRRIAQTDGIVRTYGYARLPDYGLTISTGLSDTSTLSAYYRQRNWSIAAASGLSIALLLAVVIVIRSLETRERSALTRAQTSEDSFQILVDNVTDYAVIRLDPNGFVAQWNIGAQRITGYTAGDIIGRHFSSFYTPLDIAAGKPAKALRIASELGRYEETGYRIQQSGVQFWAEVIVTVLRESDGLLVGFAAVMRDITERKKTEEAKRITEEKLAESQKLEAIGQLTGGLAHDFNNLLGIVVGNLDEIGAGLPEGNAKIRRQHQIALDAALRGAEVTRSLLAVARRQPMEVKPYDLNVLISEMLPLLRASAGSSVSLDCLLVSDKLMSMLDASGLTQVVLNLAINACDAMQDVSGEKKLTLRTYITLSSEQDNRKLTPGHYAVLEVSDTGAGMSESIRQQAFEPFFTTKERGRGTGLGLAMVYGYATQLGGTAVIDSTPGAGTTVRIFLPLQLAAATDSPGADPADPSTDSVAVAPQPFVRVLVVDDEQALCELACDWLESMGYQPTGVYSPAAALERLAAEPFDILFTDIVMPGDMDGLALAREAQSHHPHLRVILTSGYAQGLNDTLDLPGPLVNKPYRKADLLSAFQEDDGARHKVPTA
jgi:PAS domain S-box-containing protein